VSFDGDLYRYHDVGVAPAPVGGGRLPVWVGGSGKAAWKRAGRRGDGYIPMGNQVAQYPEIIDTIHAAAAEPAAPTSTSTSATCPAGPTSPAPCPRTCP
jgi:alkanesulfonate monooxygenase SsuD/methylene tetrahydromethanopterin reductase-like flavin-dependent oxidoreductase (luciferase family)